MTDAPKHENPIVDQDQEYVIKFDGINDYLELSHELSQFETGITIEFLAKGRSGLTDKTTIVEGYNSQNKRILTIHLPYYKKDTGGCISWQVENENGVDKIEKKVKSQEYRIWTYWTFVKDLTTQKMVIYRNGEMWDQGDTKYQAVIDLKKLVIGSSVDNSQFWKGHLSEFRIWNRACTQAEIKDDRNERLVGNELGLAVYLPLNGDANDHSGNGHHAIIYGASWMERKIPLKVEQLPDLEIESDLEIEEEEEETQSLKSVEPLPEVEIEPVTSSVEPLPEVEIESVSQPINSMNPKKRLVICCDGTWNELTNPYPSNVVKFARLVKYIADDKTPQLVFYLPGWGTKDSNVVKQLGGGAFGWGIDETIQEAYRLLCLNYNATAEDEIYLVGFSRGAYIARCLAGMIYKCGLLKRSYVEKIPEAYELYRDSKIHPDAPKLQEFRQNNAKKIEREEAYLNYRVPIKMLGCWDTVGTLGIPDIIPWLPVEKFFKQKYAFVEASLSPIIENAFQAVAIDEKCKSFPSTPMIPSDKNPAQKVEEVWFPGTHECIGGGNKDYRGLSDYTLQWMLNKATTLGLEFYSTEDDEEDFQIKPDFTTKFDNRVTGVYALAGEEERTIDSDHIFIHYSVVERLKSCSTYRPENLKPLLKDLLDSDSSQEA